MELMVVVGVPFGIVGARLYHVITDYQLIDLADEGGEHLTLVAARV